jgi:hypothetical protein
MGDRILNASQRGDWIELDFPGDSIEKTGIPEVLRKIVNIEIKEAYRSEFGWYVPELYIVVYR